jgi:hypothetical protein
MAFSARTMNLTAATSDDDSDNSSVEGAAFRNFFAGDSSDSDEDNDNDRIKREELMEPTIQQDVYVQREILHVRVEEQKVGGSISHRLWPAAEYLATFVMDCYHGKITHETLQKSSTDHRQQDASLPLRQQSLDSLKILLKSFSNIPILELGAGIGLTGLEMATQLQSHVLLTELDVGLPLLHRNVELNQDRFALGKDAARPQRLEWYTPQDCDKALDWYRHVAADQQPLLILASDCVYWEEFHKPLEKTLAHLLSKLPVHSMCLLAGVRRWKRDNTFYQTLGKHTRTQTHTLQCTSLQETICRDGESREVMRVYAIQWLPIESQE